MQIFISEFVCGGAWPEPVLPQSLAAEGAAMLRALCEDCARLPDANVVTTCDVRHPVTLPSSVEVVEVESTDEEWDSFLALAVAADVSIIIAPELDDALAIRIQAARDAGADVLAPSHAVTHLCSDKLRLARFLVDHGIPTIPTSSLAVAAVSDIDTAALVSQRASGGLIVKPRFGAGSHQITVITSRTVAQHLQPVDVRLERELIVQPLIPSQSFSVGVVFQPATVGREPRCDLFPVARQFLSTDGHFRYQGGLMPWNGTARTQMFDIVRRCQELLHDLAGYVGFDFLAWGGDDPDMPEVRLVEINPRLCTSYLGYRRLTDDNLASRMLPGGSTDPIEWKSRLVRFDQHGNFTVMPLPEVATCG